MRRPEVGALHAALEELLDRGALEVRGVAARRELATALEAEDARSFYGGSSAPSRRKLG